MEFLLHNEQGIPFPPLRPKFREGELYFDRFRELIPYEAENSVIGHGGTGTIHVVRDELMDRVVALKLPHHSIARDPGARADVIRETRQAIELTHPHIVRIHDYHEGRDGWGISMQYVRGKNLDEWRHEGQSGTHRSILPYPCDRIEGWIAQLCEALIYAHEDARMVHRDIKPKNLMLEIRDGGFEKLLLTDFGITQKLRMHTMLLSREQPGVSDKNTMGTLPYMPWEQIQGSPATILDDIYSIGATIYELLTGRPPFYEGGYEQIRTQVEKVVPPPMAQRLDEFDLPNHGIPKHWEDAVAACLSKRPADRPQSVRELTGMLQLVAPVANNQAEDHSVELLSLRSELLLYETTIQELESALAESRSRTVELESLESQRQAFLESNEASTRDQLREIESLKESLKLAQNESSQLKETLAGEADEVAAQLHQVISDKDQQLEELKSERAALDQQLVELQTRRQEEQSRVAALEADLAALRASAESQPDQEARLAEIEAEKNSLSQQISDLEASQRQSQQHQHALETEIAELRKKSDATEASANDRVEEARKLAQTESANARQEADQAINEAKRATALAAKAEGELAAYETKRNSPLVPLLYILLGSLIVGSGIGLAIGKFGKTAVEDVAGVDFSSYQAAIPDGPGKTGQLVPSGLFIQYLRDQGVAEADWEAMVPGISSMADQSPVQGVSWWVAENFCAWLASHELGSEGLKKGDYFRIANLTELKNMERATDDPPEWTLETPSAEASFARAIFPPAPNGKSWQIPSLGTSPDGKGLGFRVSWDKSP